MTDTYQLAKTVTRAAVIDTCGYLMLGRRTTYCHDEAGVWGVCCGDLHLGWAVAANMHRELAEEFNVRPAKVIRLEFMGYSDVVIPGGGDPALANFTALDFVAVVDREDVSLGNPEHDQLGWFTMSTLPSPLHSQLPDFLKKYEKLLGVRET